MHNQTQFITFSDIRDKISMHSQTQLFKLPNNHITFISFPIIRKFRTPRTKRSLSFYLFSFMKTLYFLKL